MSAQAHRAADTRAHDNHHITSIPPLAVLALGHTVTREEAEEQPFVDDGILPWVQAMALPEGGPVHASVLVGPPDWRWARPRGLQWEDYPLVMDMALKAAPASWGAARVHFGIGDKARAAHSLDAHVALKGADAIALLLTGPVFTGSDDCEGTLALCHQLLTAVGVAGDTAVVVVRIARAPVVTTLSGLPALCGDRMAHDRMTFSYGVNASVIHGRILADVLQRVGQDAAPKDTRCLPNDDLSLGQAVRHAEQGMISDLGWPFALQVLYRLRAFGEDGCPPMAPWHETVKEHFPGVDMASLGGAADEDGEPLWRGSGRYAPEPFDTNRVASVVRVARRFFLAEMVPVGVHGYGGLRLSRAGKAFLDAVHPDNEDPDSLLRWAAPGTANAEGMDSWVLRNFRKTKHRMAQAG